MHRLTYSKFSHFWIWASLNLVGMLIVTATYYVAGFGDFSNTWFWISILLPGSSTFLAMLDPNVSRNQKIVILALFGILLYLPYLLRSGTNFVWQDENQWYMETRLTYEKGTYNFGENFGIYRVYPGLTLLTVIVRQFLNVPIFVVARFVVGIIHPLLLGFLFLLSKKFRLPRASLV